MTTPHQDTSKALRLATKRARQLLEHDLPGQRDAALGTLVHLVVSRMIHARGLALTDLPAWVIELVSSPAASTNPRTVKEASEVLSAEDLAGAWSGDETIGWVYQYFNSGAERKAMREASQAPRDSRELAVRNQFFTPRYVVQFLTDNTLGRTWYEMHGARSVLAEHCQYMVRKPGEQVVPRAKKDPRDLRVLDPACGSGHFLLYAFDLLVTIYEEAWSDRASPKSEATGRSIRKDYPDQQTFLRNVPALILRHNLHGVEIDARCAQIARLALWLRAQRAFHEAAVQPPDRPSVYAAKVVTAEAPSDVEAAKLASNLGLLLRLEEIVGLRDFDLLTMARTRFDVVLMNPPFGACSKVAKLEFERTYPRTKNDLYAAFVERGLQMLVPHGMLGAITSRTGFFLSSFQKWREEILLKESQLTVVADLGYGVLDDAMVEVAAYCLRALPAMAIPTSARVVPVPTGVQFKQMSLFGETG